MKKTLIPILLNLLGLTAPVLLSAQSYNDKPYLQDHAEKYVYADRNEPRRQLLQAGADRNGRIRVLSDRYLMQPWEHYLVKDDLYPFLNDMNILAFATYRGHFVYLTDRAVFSNAHAGKIWIKHDMPAATGFCMGEDFSFLLAGVNHLEYYEKGKKVWENNNTGFTPSGMLYDEQNRRFLLLTGQAVLFFDPAAKKIKRVHEGNHLTAMALSDNRLIIGTGNGIYSLDRRSLTSPTSMDQKLPSTEITCIRNIGGRLWFGSAQGAFARRDDGRYDYYASKRWLVDDYVKDIAPGPGKSVLILTKKGLSRILFTPMTLAGKASYFEKIQRLRHIRYGFNARTNLTVPGDLATAVMVDSDNDGLWTSMYLAGELYRYAVTKSEDALENAYEAFEAMERLTEITGIPGFPARTYERDGYQSSDRDPDMPEDQKIWRLTPDGRWRWKSTTSSDESCGHFFVYALFADMVPDTAWRERAIHQIKIEMDHIIDHDWYLVTWNGQPTRWGRWNPEYVNSFSPHTGDRRLNSTLIIAFLQTAWHFTGDEKYKEKAYELMDKYGYLENILRPASEIGYVKGQPLSDGWNHSDDEMYFLTVRALIKYAFNDTLRTKYLATVKSHYDRIRYAKNPLWAFLYADAGGKDYDREGAVWWLKEFPLDLIAWNVDNTHRKDLTFLKPNFMGRPTKETLPPDECPLTLHNGTYELKGGEGGRREYPPYIYTLPYWLGRYVNAISAPQE